MLALSGLQRSTRTDNGKEKWLLGEGLMRGGGVAEICALIRRSPSQTPPPTSVPRDRAAEAAGVRDTCQQGDRVSSESVPCLSHSDAH